MWATGTVFKAIVYLISNGFYENDSPSLISNMFSRFGSDYGMSEGSSELNGIAALTCRMLSVMIMYLFKLHPHICGWPERMVLCSLVIQNQPPFRICKTEETRYSLFLLIIGWRLMPTSALCLSLSLLGVELCKNTPQNKISVL